jgi:hypothetical protein
MNVDFQWCSEQPSIVMLSFSGAWTYEELHELTRTRLFPQIAAKTQPVYIIVDMLNSQSIPKASPVIFETRALVQALPPNTAMVVIVTRSILIDAMMNTVKAVLDMPIMRMMHLCSTLDQAFALLPPL